MDVVYRIVKCKKCGRKMMVIRTLIGIDQNASVYVFCLDCTAYIDWRNDEWVKENPKIATELRKQLEGD